MSLPVASLEAWLSLIVPRLTPVKPPMTLDLATTGPEAELAVIVFSLAPTSTPTTSTPVTSASARLRLMVPTL